MSNRKIIRPDNCIVCGNSLSEKTAKLRTDEFCTAKCKRVHNYKFLRLIQSNKLMSNK